MQGGAPQGRPLSISAIALASGRGPAGPARANYNYNWPVGIDRSNDSMNVHAYALACVRDGASGALALPVLGWTVDLELEALIPREDRSIYEAVSA